MVMLRLEGRTYQYIADKVGVSRQRIQQLLSPPKAIRDYVVRKYDGYCSKCGIYVGSSGHIHHEGANGEEDYNDIENLQLLCIACHRGKHIKPPQSQCRYCGKPIREGIFCDRECFKKYHTVTLICSYCGKPYSLSTSDAQARIERNSSGLMYCSKKCYGKWLGENYGFGVYPEHIGAKVKRKWDYKKVYQARDETGFGALKLSRLLGIPMPTITVILQKREGVKKRIGL